VDVDYDKQKIMKATKAQIQHGPYPSEPIYGDGQAGTRIADILSTCTCTIQKRLVY
jgi:hypothetical protein